MKIFLIINVKMPTIVDTLRHFMSRKIAFSAYFSLKNAEFLNSFLKLMSILNFMLS